jgi:hypothetical protein
MHKHNCASAFLVVLVSSHAHLGGISVYVQLMRARWEGAIDCVVG